MSFPLFLTDANGNPMVYSVPVFSNVAGATWSPVSDTPTVATVAMDPTGKDVEMSMVAAGSFSLTVTDTAGLAPAIPAQAFTVLATPAASAPFSGLDLDGASGSGAAPVSAPTT